MCHKKLWLIKFTWMQEMTISMTDVIRKTLCHSLLDHGIICLINNFMCCSYAIPFAPSLANLHSQVRTKWVKPQSQSNIQDLKERSLVIEAYQIYLNDLKFLAKDEQVLLWTFLMAGLHCPYRILFTERLEISFSILCCSK